MKSATITRERLCEITGLTDRRHQQLAAAGWFPPSVGGKYQTELTLAGMIKYLAEDNRKKAGDLKAEQLALTRAKRQIAEEDLAEQKGEYIKRSEVAPALRNLALSVRSMLIRKYEQELAPKLPHKPYVQVLELVREANDSVCHAMNTGAREMMKISLARSSTVEQGTHNPLDAGSNPVGPTNPEE